MKKIILVLLAMALVMLVGCSSNMTKIHKHFDNYGQPVIEDKIQKGDQTMHYFFVNLTPDVNSGHEIVLMLRPVLHRTVAHRQPGIDTPAVLGVFADCRRPRCVQ